MGGTGRSPWVSLPLPAAGGEERGARGTNSAALPAPVRRHPGVFVLFIRSPRWIIIFNFFLQRFPGGKKNNKKKRQEGTTSSLAEEADKDDVGDAVTLRSAVRSAEDGSAIRKVPRLREEGRKPERAPARPGRSAVR